MYDEAENLGVHLDLPAYRDLVRLKLDRNAVQDAMRLLHSLCSRTYSFHSIDFEAGSLSPDDSVYMPIIRRLLINKEYGSTLELFKRIRFKCSPLPRHVYDELEEYSVEMSGSKLRTAAIRLAEYMQEAYMQDYGHDFSDSDDD